MEEVEWAAALATPQRTTLEALLAKYPKSPRVDQAREALWALDWPPVAVERADTVTIWSSRGGLRMGQMSYSIGGLMSGNATPTAGPVSVHIWREFPPAQEARLKKAGIRIGMAFLQPDPEKSDLKFIRKVDLSKTDKQLADEFRVFERK